MARHPGSHSSHHNVARAAGGGLILALAAEVIPFNYVWINSPQEPQSAQYADFRSLSHCLTDTPYQSAAKTLYSGKTAILAGVQYELPSMVGSAPTLHLQADELPTTLEVVWRPVDKSTNEILMRYCGAQVLADS